MQTRLEEQELKAPAAARLVTLPGRVVHDPSGLPRSSPNAPSSGDTPSSGNLCINYLFLIINIISLYYQ